MVFEPLLTTRDLAEIFRVPDATIRAWRKTGRIRGVQVGRHLRFKKRDVEAALGAALERAADHALPAVQSPRGAAA